MFDLDRYKEIWQTITRNRMRSILTGFGVAWGIFMYVVMMGLSNGIENGINSMITDMPTNAIFFYPNTTSMEYMGYNSGRYWSITSKDIEVIKKKVPEVEYISGGVYSSSEGKTVRGERSGTYSVRGIDNSHQKISPSPIIYGRYINDFDMQEKRKVCVVGHKMYEELFDRGENPIGESITVDGVSFRVVGVVRPNENTGNGSNTAYIPTVTLQQIYNMGDVIHTLSLSAYDHIDATQVEEKVKTILREQHFIAPQDEMAIYSFNLKEMFMRYRNMFLGLNILTWIVGMGTMLAGAVGVSNIMLVSIKERTQEIGIRRAIGAKPANILTQILSESMLLTFIAGFCGLFAGMLILFGVDKVLGAHVEIIKAPYISFTMAIIASLIILAAGAVAGIIPAKTALSVKAIDAIRDES